MISDLFLFGVPFVLVVGVLLRASWAIAWNCGWKACQKQTEFELNDWASGFSDALQEMPLDVRLDYTERRVAGVFEGIRRARYQVRQLHPQQAWEIFRLWRASDKQKAFWARLRDILSISRLRARRKNGKVPNTCCN